MLSLSGGKWKGRKFAADVSSKTRPTAIRAREGLFNVIEHRFGQLHDLNVADLFAGTGALGLEALSRGAAQCTFVELDRGASQYLKRVLAELGANAKLCQETATSCKLATAPFDLVFLDPPYGQDLLTTAIENLIGTASLKEDGLLIAEIDKKDKVPELAGLDLQLVQDRAWGRNRYLFWQFKLGIS